jgi:hypothetical protein
MPEFSLRPLGKADLAALGVPPDIVALLGPNAGQLVPGFNAVLYQDFIAGEDQYVLTFRGTDDDIWAREWDDWINNIAQGLGRYAPQYKTAMQLAEDLIDLQRFTTANLMTTGQSLGGGLASAAAVASGMQAHIFNAAGLHEDTLYRRLPNGQIELDGQGNKIAIHQGSVARFNSPPGTFVQAWNVDYDILSFLQDNTPIPDAIGFRNALDGPFDLVMGLNGAILVGGLAIGQNWLATSAALDGVSTMVEAHGHPAILFGLLGDASGYYE